MDIKTKHRIIGIVILVALAVIVLPLFFTRSNNSEKAPTLSAHVPNPPAKPVIQPLTIPDQANNNSDSQPSASPDMATQTAPNANATNADANSPPSKMPAADDRTSANLNNNNAATQNLTATANNATSNNAATTNPATPAASPDTTSSNDDSTVDTTIPEDDATTTPATKHQVPRTKTGAAKAKLAMLHAEKKHALRHRQHEKLAKPAALAHAWTIQLASFTQKNNADQLVKKLRAKGFAAYVHMARSDKGDVSRVYVGPELKKLKASEIAKRLHEEFRMQGVVVEYKV